MDVEYNELDNGNVSHDEVTVMKEMLSKRGLLPEFGSPVPVSLTGYFSDETNLNVLFGTLSKIGSGENEKVIFNSDDGSFALMIYDFENLTCLGPYQILIRRFVQ